MSEKHELLGKYDVKLPQLLRMSIRSCINDRFKALSDLVEKMRSHKDYEELFGQYFEDFSVDYMEIIAVLGFLYEMEIISSVVYDAVLFRLDFIQDEVIELFKLVYVDNE